VALSLVGDQSSSIHKVEPPYRRRVVDVVFPVLDERDALPWVLGHLPGGYRAIVVDNGSTDGSARVAADLGAQVIHESQRGFGAACWAGLEAATAPVVAFCDADGSLDPAELPRVVRPVEHGDVDLVLGARCPTTPGAWSRHARLANRYLAARLRRTTGAPLTDLGPMRAARREALIGLGVEDRRSGWPLEMVLRAAGAGWRISEVAVSYRPRVGHSKVTGTISGTLTAIQDMGRVLAHHRS
jgi:glycosyltransferase involved in cell wall biosynthesis